MTKYLIFERITTLKSHLMTFRINFIILQLRLWNQLIHFPISLNLWPTYNRSPKSGETELQKKTLYRSEEHERHGPRALRRNRCRWRISQISLTSSTVTEMFINSPRRVPTLQKSQNNKRKDPTKQSNSPYLQKLNLNQLALKNLNNKVLDREKLFLLIVVIFNLRKLSQKFYYNFQYLNMEQGAIKTIGKYSYYTQKCLGEGSFGKVFQGYQNTTKQKVAVKKVDFKTIQKDPYLERAIHEQIRILSKFKHPNIVQLMQVLNSKRSLYIIMEYCRDGDLKKYLKKRQKEGLAQSEVLVIMKQIIKGYQELARNNIIHRDLKPANILINGGYFKICDFGFSKVIKDPTVANKTCVGSPIYMAPQILDKKDYSAKCDIWSLGIIFYELLHSVVPWTAKSQRELLAKIKTQSFPCTRASPQTQKLIRQMLEVSQQRRASLRDLQSFFNLEVEKLVPSKEAPMWEQQPSGMSDPPVRIQRTQQLPSNLQPSTQTKVLNRNYFEELAWRYFVCIELRTNLNFLNRFNFKQNIFERYIVLLISSVISSLKKKKLQIERIHQKEAIAKIKQETECYIQFQKDFYEFLNEGYSTCQILKEFDLIDVAASNFTEQTSKRAELDLIKNTQVILKQLQQQAKLTQDQQQRASLLSIAELILDMILLNEKQARTGASQIDPYLADRGMRTLDKRFAHKIMSLKQVKRTEFY